MESFRLVEQWPVGNAAAAVVRPGHRVELHGQVDRAFPLASVTKPLTAYATLIAVEEGALSLDTPAGPPGSTLAHLLAHCSGLAFDDPTPVAQPGTRRIYSNAGFAAIGQAIEEHTGMPFTRYATDAVLTPLGMGATRMTGSPATGASSTVADLSRFASELLSPTLLDPGTLATATSVAFGGLDGVLPGYGRQEPNDWGLGFEIRDGKSPHWTGRANSPATYGHFGRAGTFLWVDPNVPAACVALTDRSFGPWAAEAWPEFSDSVLAELRNTGPRNAQKDDPNI